MQSRTLFGALMLLPFFVASTQLPILGGMNIAGMEFGVGTDGASTGGSQTPPVDQIPHFIATGANLFRIPMGWQYVQPQINGELNTTYLDIYDTLIKSATDKGSYAILDIHNYARRDGVIVGEGSSLPASALSDLWTKLAAKYNSNSMVMYGLMNEPHDLTLATWISTVQDVVTAVRGTGATNHILLPGDNWTGLGSFPTFYAAGLNKVANPDGTTDNLIFDVHRYLDSDGSGTNVECTDNRLDDLAAAVAVLKADNRQAILSEVGGGSTSSCEEMLPQLIAGVKDAYPSMAGFSLWAAGSFKATMTDMAMVPVGNENTPNFKAVQYYLPGTPTTGDSTNPSGASGSNSASITGAPYSSGFASYIRPSSSMPTSTQSSDADKPRHTNYYSDKPKDSDDYSDKPKDSDDYSSKRQ